jgi:site-specific DNA recombinase
MSKATVNVAVYCRKSTDEGLDSDFNSLDAQRQSCENFIASQKNEGWVALPETYSDGGFSGSNTERPGLQALLRDVEAGKVQVIAVYKLDRLSRSLIDFVALLEKLEKHGVAFVSVTQHFNTATPMGRLMLNILICFAQFERENMIERVRDKIAATKRLGKWCGGQPPLGYDVVPGGRKIVINEAEAAQVQAIFDLYLELRSIAEVKRELDERGWVNKRRTSRKGRISGGKPWLKSTLGNLLGNITYTGRIAYQGEIYQGEHQAIIDIETYEKVQHMLAQQKQCRGAERRIKHHALLGGLLRCGACDCGMTYSWSRRKTKVYGYYSCANSRVEGAEHCPLPNVPAAEIEKLVVDEIATIAKAPEVIDRVIAEASVQHDQAIAKLQERVEEAEKLVKQAAASAQRNPEDAIQSGLKRQADMQVEALRANLAAAEKIRPSSYKAKRMLAQFELIWTALTKQERHRFMQEIVEHVTLDGHTGKVAFTFKAEGFAQLANWENKA